MGQQLAQRIDFYERGGGMVDATRGYAVPRAGEYVNINRKQWRVSYVSWSLDVSPLGTKDLRANVELEKVPDDEVGPDQRGI